MIMAQTHIFNFFPGSIHSGRVLKTLSLFASRQKNTYLPNQQVWLNKLYFQISNSNEKKSITVDTRDVNNLGPGKFRTMAENNTKQICYFNRNNSYSHYSSYLSKRVNQENLVFSIFKMNFNLNSGYKNLEINSEKFLFHGDVSEKQQSINRENFRDGKNSGSETSKNDRRSNGPLQSEPIFARGRSGMDITLSRNRGDSSSDQLRGSARKKPRFLSN